MTVVATGQFSIVDINDGARGPSVLVTTNRQTTFTAKDGALDVSQAPITFTANTSGVTSPTYVWSFIGLQSAPTASTTATQVITSAQFGTTKSALIACKVTGSDGVAYTDTSTVSRLELSTAAAGADVTATSSALATTNANVTTAQNTATDVNNWLTAALADNNLSTAELNGIRGSWDGIVAERSTINAQALTYAVSSTAYDAALVALGTFLNGGAWTTGIPQYITPSFISSVTTSGLVISATTGADFRAKVSTFELARTAVFQGISDKAATLANYSGLTGTVPAGILNSNVTTTTLGAATTSALATTNANVVTAGTTANWTGVSSRPTSLATLNSTDGTKLTGIAIGATANTGAFATLSGQITAGNNATYFASGSMADIGGTLDTIPFTTTKIVSGILNPNGKQVLINFGVCLAGDTATMGGFTTISVVVKRNTTTLVGPAPIAQLYSTVNTQQITTAMTMYVDNTALYVNTTWTATFTFSRASGIPTTFGFGNYAWISVQANKT